MQRVANVNVNCIIYKNWQHVQKLNFISILLLQLFTFKARKLLPQQCWLPRVYCLSNWQVREYLNVRTMKLFDFIDEYSCFLFTEEY